MLLDYRLRNYNFRLFLYVLLLNIIGVFVLRSASNQDMAVVGKQIMGIVIGFAVVIGLSLVDYHRVLSTAPVIYAGCVLLLAAVLVFGVSKGIATRWIRVPLIGQIQPAEFVKIGLIVFLAWYFDKYQDKINQFVTLLIGGGLFFIAFFLIFSQPNLSTSLVTMVIFLSMLFVAGLSFKWIFGALAVVLPCGGLFVYLLKLGAVPFLADYQVRRILAFFDKSGYAEANLQQNNSIMAIGSGMFWGKGLNTTTLSSVKNGNFLSEEETDFIFAVVGEELGFIGSVVVIILMALIVYECLMMAARAKDLAGRLLCVGLATLFAFQSFANIAVATGIFPNTGLPLPFISSGVSSLLSLYFGIGIVMNVGLQRRNNNYERY
ncbi:FtsW/RodA/SpoVE family cell cycle protein [Brotaphodocola sp.]|uniref:FtsW/RodA/SpoVE family cell cycle protein n=1 Tax=Brotaphodocola sp. TaxID=3073577 RepID=UPI003D7ED0A6